MLSIVIPCYYEEENIPLIYQQIINVVGGLYSLEIIFVDDGSGDGTFKRVEELAINDERVKGIRLSRNFGHQIALLAGLNEVKGNRVMMMDADGQHPPELIPRMMDKMDEGYEIVNTRRVDTSDAGYFKKQSSKSFYWFFNSLSDVKLEEGSSDFRVMNREAVDAFLRFDEQSRFTRGLIGWMGFRQASIPFVAPVRAAGKTKYSRRKMFRFAFDGLTAFTYKPLRISTYLGLIVLLLGVIYAIYAVVVYFLGRINPGWTSLLITILILGGTQLLILGIIGEYIARIFTETKKRPHYFISQRTA